MRLEWTTSHDISAVGTLLHVCSLPLAGIEETLLTLMVAHESDTIMEYAAFEVSGSVALLRSVAVEPSCQGDHWGSNLFVLLTYAASHSLREVYLLTETASDFFLRFGFRSVERVHVSRAIHASVEWTSVCLVSAQVMVLVLDANRSRIVSRMSM